jgi:hypothetical protein
MSPFHHSQVIDGIMEAVKQCDLTLFLCCYFLLIFINLIFFFLSSTGDADSQCGSVIFFILILWWWEEVGNILCCVFRSLLSNLRTKSAKLYFCVLCYVDTNITNIVTNLVRELSTCHCKDQ